MSELTNEEFIEFIKSYDDFLLPVTEITKNHRNISLIDNAFKLYFLDNIIWSIEDSIINIPRATDALFYKNENGKLTLYIIEFKFANINESNRFIAYRLLDQLNYENNNQHEDKLDEQFYQDFKEFCYYNEDNNIINAMFNVIEAVNDKNHEENLDNQFYQDFKKICYTYEDKLLVNIIFKVIESLNIVIPELYEKYCNECNIPVKDIRQYLRNIDKKFVLFTNDNQNKSKLRLQSTNDYLNQQLKKLVRGKIIDEYNIESNSSFEKFLKLEKLI